jgi:molybdopterin converting factor small subunit
MELDREDVEVTFINGKVAPFNKRIQDGDRVALVPPGTPGPYRVCLGFKNESMM